MSLRVLIAVPSLACGGAERVACEIAAGLSVRGNVTAVLTLSGSQSDHYNVPSTVKRIALNMVADSQTIAQSVIRNLHRCLLLRTAVAEFHADVVVSFIEQMNVLTLASLLGTRTPVVVSERIDPRAHSVGRAWDTARKALYPFASHIVVQTEDVARGWAAGIAKPERIVVIPNFVRDLPPAPPWGVRKENLILAVGRLHRQKGIDILLRAFALSGLAGRGMQLVVLGEGPERAELKRLALRLGIAHAVYMEGRVSNPESWQAEATMFVLPSRYEGFPNVLLEAMAMGCSVIAADCPSGPRDILTSGRDGLLVPVEDEQALAKAMLTLADDSSLRRRIGRRAIRVRARYARETVMREWERVIFTSAERA